MWQIHEMTRIYFFLFELRCSSLIHHFDSCEFPSANQINGMTNSKQKGSNKWSSFFSIFRSKTKFHSIENFNLTKLKKWQNAQLNAQSRMTSQMNTERRSWEWTEKATESQKFNWTIIFIINNRQQAAQKSHLSSLFFVFLFYFIPTCWFFMFQLLTFNEIASLFPRFHLIFHCLRLYSNRWSNFCVF